MANLPNRPKGRSVRNLRMVWRFALHHPGHIAIAAAALLVAAAATSGIPYGFKLIIDKGFAQGSGTTRDLSRWFELLLAVVAVMAVATAVRYFFVSWLGERTVDTTIIEQVVGTTVSVALRNSVLSIVCIVILFALSAKLASLILIGAAL